VNFPFFANLTPYYRKIRYLGNPFVAHWQSGRGYRQLQCLKIRDTAVLGIKQIGFELVENTNGLFAHTCFPANSKVLRLAWNIFVAALGFHRPVCKLLDIGTGPAALPPVFVQGV